MGGLLQRRPDLVASLGVALASVLWGLYWIPLRYLGERGLDGGWAGLAAFCVTGAILMPLAWLRRRGLAAGGAGLALSGLMTGSALALYSTSLLMTEVVRVLLLFYLTPVWSTLLGLVLLKERVTLARTAALALGIAGLLVVLGVDEGYPLPRNAGDWLALLSGMFWAYGCLCIFRDARSGTAEQSIALVAGACLVSLLVVALPIEAVGMAPDPGVWRATAVALILVALLLVLPIVFLTLGGARRLSPARVGILLMGEVAVGVASAAILTDEPFGLREILGTILVLGATGVEVLQRPPPRPGPVAPSITAVDS